MVWNENGKWEMENANMQVQRQSWAEGVQVGFDDATASTSRQRGQLIVAARPTIAACTTLWHTKYIEEFCLPLTLSVLATKPPSPLMPRLPFATHAHTRSLGDWVLWQLAKSATNFDKNVARKPSWVVGGRQQQQHMKHMKHKWSAIKCAK